MPVPLRALVPKRSYNVSFEPVSSGGRNFSFPGLGDTLLPGAERTMSENEAFYLGFLLLLLPFGALADGKMISAFPANVTMPDQQALIHFTNGTERLVIGGGLVGRKDELVCPKYRLLDILWVDGRVG
jgi:hypothetical protein